MTASALIVNSIPPPSGANPVYAGSTYNLIPVGNISLEQLPNLQYGLATVTGTGLGIDGPNWLMAYYGQQWLVHNMHGSTYATYALDFSTTTPGSSSPPATAAAAPSLLSQITNGHLVLVIGVVILIAVGVGVYMLYVKPKQDKRNGGMKYGAGTLF